MQVWSLAADQNADQNNVNNAIAECKNYFELAKTFELPEEKLMDVTRTMVKLEKAKAEIQEKEKQVAKDKLAQEERSKWMKSLGGIVVAEKDGHGLVMANADIGKMNLKEARKACEDLVLNNYDDWRLPTLAEFTQMLALHNQLLKSNPPQFMFTILSGQYHVIPAFDSRKIALADHFVRPVRNF